MLQLDGLKWAEASTNPHGKSRPRGTKAMGLAYERKVAKALPKARHNPWFRFCDNSGVHFCSPDLLLLTPRVAVVIEVKLTDTSEAWAKLLGLYKPVLELVIGREVLPMVVVKNLRPTSLNVVTSGFAALQEWEKRPVLHWLGVGQFPWE
jgi:hypothetical protein